MFEVVIKLTFLMNKSLKEGCGKTTSVGYRRDDDGRQLLVIANDSYMRRLKISFQASRSDCGLTPFIKGMIVKGSVAIEASSIKTMG
jgi:hypothetical protein